MSTENAIERGKSSQVIPITIPAGGVANRPATGSFLYLVEAPARVKVRIETEAAVDMTAGCGIRATGGASFNFFEIENPQAFAVTVKVFVGFSEYIDQRAEVMDPPTATTGSGVVTLAAGGSIILDGNPPAGCIRRKSLLVTNFDLANPIMIETPAGVAIGACLPRTAWRENISGAVRLSNPSGGGISCIVGEVWNATR